MFRSGNPSLKKSFDDFKSGHFEKRMTINGTVHKSFFAIILLMVAAFYSWSLFDSGVDTTVLMIVGAIGGFVVAMVTVFKMNWAPYTTPIYVILQGLFIGSISAMYDFNMPGIVQQAVMLTFGVLFAMLAAYRSGMIKVTEKFKLGIISAMGAIFLFYILNFVLSFFGMSVPFLHDSSPIGILISVVIVIVAALSLILDFDLIVQGEKNGAPKYMEWYGAFALMVTLVWLYIEILRLLSKIYNRD